MEQAQQTWREAQRARLFEWTGEQAALLSMDKTGAVWLQEANPALQKRLGWSHTVASCALEQALPMDEATTLRHSLRKARRSTARYQRTVPTSQGLRQLEGWVFGLGEHQESHWWLWRVRDKTDALEARSAARLMRRRLQSVLEVMPWPACMVDERLDLVQCNTAWSMQAPGFLSWLGTSPGDPIFLPEARLDTWTLRRRLFRALKDTLAGSLRDWSAPLPARVGSLRIRSMEPADAGAVLYLEPSRVQVHGGAWTRFEPQAPMPDRRDLEAHMEHLWSDQLDQAVCLGMMEVAQLDRVKKKLGKHSMEEVVTSMARRLARSLRPTDVVARIRRGRLAFVCPVDADAQVAHSLGQRLARNLGQPLQVQSSQLLVQSRLGVVLARPRETAPDDMMALASSALARARRSGEVVIREEL